MSLLQRACRTLGISGLIAVMPALAFGQSSYVPQAGEFLPAGSLAGDQLHPSLSLNTNGGFLVWQDNITDGSGYGISAQQLDSSLSPKLGVFRVNYTGTNDQENPKVALLKNGGAAFVWQSGKQSFQHIYARFLTPTNTWITPTNDVMVSTATNHYQVNPAMSVLTNGNVIVTWSSYGQDNADGLQGVYAQILSPTGVKVGGEFLVNQFTPYNQRSPAVAAFANGNFIIAWVSEQERSVQATGTFQLATSVPSASVDIYARMFSSSGTPLGNEFLVNTDSNICSSPAIAVASDGTFMITWCEKDTVVVNNSWDVFARPFSSSGSGGTVQLVNTQQYGDQYSPKIASVASDYMVVWTSMGQDGSREGVFGQILNGDASHAGGEFRVNTTVLNQQIHPAVASDGSSRFMVAWSSFVGGIDSMDLNAQRYANTSQLSQPGPPIVSAVGSNMLSVTWPPLAGFSVDHWELYADGSGTPNVTTNLYWSAGPYAPGSTHSFQLAYVLTDSRRSPLSTSASGQTWGVDANNDGLPDNWQAIYWGTNSANWPSANTLLRPGGPTVLQVFLWGANPLDPSTWLTQTISQTSEGLFLSWNTHAGYIYQVQTCTDAVNWTDLGAPRYAAGTTDSIYLGVGGGGGGAFARYRIIRLVN